MSINSLCKNQLKWNDRYIKYYRENTEYIIHHIFIQLVIHQLTKKRFAKDEHRRLAVFVIPPILRLLAYMSDMYQIHTDVSNRLWSNVAQLRKQPLLKFPLAINKNNLSNDTRKTVIATTYYVQTHLDNFMRFQRKPFLQNVTICQTYYVYNNHHQLITRAATS